MEDARDIRVDTCWVCYPAHSRDTEVPDRMEAINFTTSITEGR